MASGGTGTIAASWKGIFMSNSPPFPSVSLPSQRSEQKPRSSGVTMMADWGIPLHHQEDLLKLGGRYLDFAKIVTGTARLYERNYLIEKLELYKREAVRPFIGGQFFEYVLANQGWKGLEPFLSEALLLGFDTIEISDNCIPLSGEERKRAVDMALAAGLRVMGEVGSKNQANEAEELIGQAQDFFDAGAEYVLVEAAELIEDGRIKPQLLIAIRGRLELSRVMIELPGPWISGVSLSLVQDLKKAIVSEFGPDVNLANIHAEDVIATEAIRVGLGVVGPTKRMAQ